MSPLVKTKHNEMHLHDREEAVGIRSVLQHIMFWEKTGTSLKGYVHSQIRLSLRSVKESV